jgi:hypothetical protein
MMQTIVHYGLHFIAPIAIAFFFYRSHWKTVSLIFLATMLVDLDHLVSTPIFDPNRCSIGFHPLHSYWAIGVYIALLFFKKTRIVGIGLVLHMIADSLDCF